MDDTRFIGNYVSMGNPHLVIFVNNVENIDIEKLHLNYDFNKVNLLIEEEKNYSKQFLDSVLKTN